MLTRDLQRGQKWKQAVAVVRRNQSDEPINSSQVIRMDRGQINSKPPGDRRNDFRYGEQFCALGFTNNFDWRPSVADGASRTEVIGEMVEQQVQASSGTNFQQSDWSL